MVTVGAEAGEVENAGLIVVDAVVTPVLSEGGQEVAVVTEVPSYSVDDGPPDGDDVPIIAGSKVVANKGSRIEPSADIEYSA